MKAESWSYDLILHVLAGPRSVTTLRQQSNGVRMVQWVGAYAQIMYVLQEGGFCDGYVLCTGPAIGGCPPPPR